MTAKQAIRKEILKKRLALEENDINLWSRTIQEQVIGSAPFISAKRVALYYPIKKEVETALIFRAASFKEIFYPCWDPAGCNISFAQVRDLGSLRPTGWGTMEPATTKAQRVARGSTLRDRPSSIVIARSPADGGATWQSGSPRSALSGFARDDGRRRRVPEATGPVAPNLDLILLPGVVFDLNGYRLGYGYGGYDRLLAGFKGEVWGLAYEIQIVDTLPIEKHDIPCNYVITEKRIITR